MTNDPFATSPKEIPVPPYRPMNEDDETSAEKSACIIVVVIFIVLALAGFGIWYYLKHRATPVGKTPPPQPGTTTAQQNEKKDPNLISASEGGSVFYIDPQGNKAAVIIPPFALTKDTKIEIERVSAGSVTDLYHLKPDGLKFLKPVTVVIPYKESGLAGSQTPNDIDLEYWFKKKYGKQMIDFTVDLQAHTLSAKVMEF